MPKDKISDEYCNASIAGCVQQLKDVGVPVADIIEAFNRATLNMQHDEWRRKEKGNV